MRPARIPIAQHSRNPSPRDREILTLLAEGHTQKDTARILEAKPRTITAAVERMRDRYTAPSNEALVALAIRLQWIALEIDCTQDTVDTARKR
jgi:DNA-binding CsgD family transcriptional regulator